MQGYLLYRDVDGEIVWIPAHRATRAHLIRALNALIPEDTVILGYVLGQDTAQLFGVVA
jgi:hypothetical protein